MMYTLCYTLRRIVQMDAYPPHKWWVGGYLDNNDRQRWLVIDPERANEQVWKNLIGSVQ